MVVVTIYALNFAHPGFLVGRTIGRNQIAVDAEKKDSALLGTP